MTKQHATVERVVTEGQRRAYDAEAVNVAPRRDSGGQTMEYARDLAQRAQELVERAEHKLAPLSVVTVEERCRAVEEPPQAPFFRELYEHLAMTRMALDAIEAALDAVDV